MSIQPSQPFSSASQAVQPAVNEALDQIGQTYRSATATAEDAVHQGKEYLEQSYQAASEKAGEAVKQGREYLQKNPLSATLTTLAIGFAVGYWMGHQRQTFSQRLASDPINTLREALLSGLHR